MIGMKIQELFARDIHRSINGVVKADQLDDSSVWQELDEFVVTRELNGHINDLVAVLLSTMGGESGAADKNGVWISGFFGCGKSHLIKVLSYLLENGEHVHGDQKRRAVDFFADKFSDAMLYADLQRVVRASTETILFNVDSKADHRAGRDALLQVFLKVLNEKQGYSGDYPHIAHMERHLEEKGKLDAFRAAFERESGEPWLQQRDGWEFHRDEVVAALAEVLGQSAASVEKWVDGGVDNFSLTVENFAKWVKRYLDSQSADHRIMFLVDEVGQFIGNDTHLMLNLQTIVEELGTVCGGRAWVVVTSQEDLDSVLGELRSPSQHDFSKIQGRFRTRLSLSSSNVDEVIKKRLLEKRDSAGAPLAEAYEGKHDILRNQLSFVNAGMTFKSYADASDFAACYPFAAYQFTLVQKVFESIRKAGATGLNLARGERSMLDAFQSAVIQMGSSGLDTLVPFYRFYPSVEGFLDTAVKLTIDKARDNHALKPFDSTLLQLLFLIRYVEELHGSVDNLVTLCVDKIDADRLALRRQIEESLERLERETLVSRNGDLYFFLTNEERDIGREIKGLTIASGAEERELGKILFEDILRDARKHTYSVTGKDFPYTRSCDGHVVGQKLEGSLEVSFVSPLGDNFAQFADDSAGIMHTSHQDGCVLICLPDEPNLGRELRTYLQTDSYVKTKQGAHPETTKRILRERADDNRDRRKRIQATLDTMLAKARYFASGKRQEINRTDPKDALGDALEYLIQNAFPKLGYIERPHPNPKQEIQSMLRANDVGQQLLAIETVEANPKALQDVREYVRGCATTNRQIILSEMMDRYGGRPWGWSDLEVAILVSRLAVLREIDLFKTSKEPLPLDQAYDYLTASSKQRQVLITLRENADSKLIKAAQLLGKELFAQQGGSGEDVLFAFLKQKLTDWHAALLSYEPLAKTGDYPGLSDIQDCLETLRKFVEESDSVRFLTRFVDNKDELHELAENVQELEGFYTNQKRSWVELSDAIRELSGNRLQLNAHESARPALLRMDEIRASQRPYNMLREVADLIATARSVNNELMAAARGPALMEIQRHLDGVRSELDRVSASDSLRKQCITELASLLVAAGKATSIAHIAEAQNAAGDAYDRAWSAMEEAQAVPVVVPGKPAPPPQPAIKKRRVVEPKALWPEGFLETPSDVEAFLGKLRAALQAAIDAGERVQIK